MIVRIRNLVGVAVILFPLMGYMYVKGGQDGVAWYKRSKQFSYALMSAYGYGLWDGCNDDKTHTCSILKKGPQ